MTNKLIVFLLLVINFSFAQDSAKTQAHKMFARVSGGVAPSAAQLTQMENFIKSGDYFSAAGVVVDADPTANITFKEFAKQFFDLDNGKNLRNDLNDGSATIVGMIVNDDPFNELLSHNYFYSFEGVGGGGANSVSIQDNNHYQAAESSNLNLAQNLKKEVTSDFNNNMTPNSAAGIWTTRGFASVFIEAGTNRAPIKWINEHIFGREMLETMDNTVPGKYVGRDVFALPTGGVKLRQSYCIACHNQMDGMRGAFAELDFERELEFTPGDVADKYNINIENNPTGYETVDSQWVNYYATGVNKKFGFYGQLSGYGAKSLGASLTKSRVFAETMANKVFEKICYRKATSTVEKTLIQTAASSFETTYGYKMKELFKDITANSKCYLDNK